MSNKRIVPRRRTRLQLSLADRGQAFTFDVSPGGFAVELPRPIPPGTTVRGELRMVEHKFPFIGQVCWARAGEPRLGVRARLGVRFTGIANAFFERFLAAFGAGPRAVEG